MEGERLPIPDPTLLTTQQLLREIASLKEIFENRMREHEKLGDVKFKSVIDLITANVVTTDIRITDNSKLYEERHASAQAAIGKSEGAISRQVDQIVVQMHTMVGGLSDKIDDARNRLMIMEGSTKGATSLWGYFVGGIGVLMTMATLGALVFRGGS